MWDAWARSPPASRTPCAPRRRAAARAGHDVRRYGARRRATARSRSAGADRAAAPNPKPGQAVGAGCQPPASMELRDLLEAERDSALGEVIGRHFHVHAVAGQNTDTVLAHLAGGVGQHFVLVVQFDPEHRIWEQLGHRPRKFNKVFFRHVASLFGEAARYAGKPRIGRGYKPFCRIPQFPPVWACLAVKNAAIGRIPDCSPNRPKETRDNSVSGLIFLAVIS